jgi:heat shock protein HtpX
VWSFIRLTLLLGLLTGIFIGTGFLLGGTGGMTFALIFAVIFNFSSYWYSDKIVLRMYGAKIVSESEAPKLHRMVSNLAKKAELPKPKVAIVHSGTPNAFATGRSPKNAVVAVTTGAMDLLRDDELEGVLGHEIAHIKNRDTLISVMAASIAGAISYLAVMAQWALVFGRRDRDMGNLAGALVAMIVAPIAAAIVQFAISRSREYKADAYGGKISHPLALASALESLERGIRQKPMQGNPATAHLFIVNPFKGRSMWSTVSGLFSTHPSTEERVRRLREMAG